MRPKVMNRLLVDRSIYYLRCRLFNLVWLSAFTYFDLVGFPIACEGDIDGTIGCLIGKLLGAGTVYLSDWLEHDKSTLTLWHGGMAPEQVRPKLNESSKKWLRYLKTYERLIGWNWMKGFFCATLI